MVGLVDEAMAAGALGFSSSLAPTHLDLADRPIPSRLASLDEVRALADAVGRHGRGSIAFAPESAVEGISPEDRDLLIELAGRGGVPSITQGLGGRSKVDAPTKTWEESRRFLDRSAALGTPVYSLLMTRALNGPFTVAEGTSRYEGVPSWHRLMTAPLEEKRRLLADPEERARLRHGIDHPNLDPAQGHDPAPTVLGEPAPVRPPRSTADQRWMGRAMADIAAERGRAPGRRAARPRPGRRPAGRLPLVERDPGVARAAQGRAEAPADDRGRVRRRRPPRPRRRAGVVDPLPRHVVAHRAGVAAGGGHPADDRDPGRRSSGWPTAACSPPAGPPTCSCSTPSASTSARAAARRTRCSACPRFRGVPVGIEATIVNGTVVVERGERADARPGQVVRPA